MDRNALWIERQQGRGLLLALWSNSRHLLLAKVMDNLGLAELISTEICQVTANEGTVQDHAYHNQ